MNSSKHTFSIPDYSAKQRGTDNFLYIDEETATLVSTIYRFLTLLPRAEKHFVFRSALTDILTCSYIFTEEEIRTIVNESQKEGVIESTEKKIINNLFDFGDSTAKDIMIPLSKTVMLDNEDEIDEKMINIFKIGHSRIPVYSKT